MSSYVTYDNANLNPSTHGVFEHSYAKMWGSARKLKILLFAFICNLQGNFNNLNVVCYACKIYILMCVCMYMHECVCVSKVVAVVAVATKSHSVAVLVCFSIAVIIH